MPSVACTCPAIIHVCPQPERNATKRSGPSYSQCPQTHTTVSWSLTCSNASKDFGRAEKGVLKSFSAISPQKNVCVGNNGGTAELLLHGCMSNDCNRLHMWQTIRVGVKELNSIRGYLACLVVSNKLNLITFTYQSPGLALRHNDLGSNIGCCLPPSRVLTPAPQ